MHVYHFSAKALEMLENLKPPFVRCQFLFTLLKIHICMCIAKMQHCLHMHLDTAGEIFIRTDLKMKLRCLK